MSQPINASDHEMIEQVMGIRALVHAFQADWQPVRIGNFAKGAQGLPIGEYHLLLAGHNSGSADSPDFNGAAVTGSFMGLAGSVSQKLTQITASLVESMQSIIAAGDLLDNAEYNAEVAAEKFAPR